MITLAMKTSKFTVIFWARRHWAAIAFLASVALLCATGPYTEYPVSTDFVCAHGVCR